MEKVQATCSRCGRKFEAHVYENGEGPAYGHVTYKRGEPIKYNRHEYEERVEDDDLICYECLMAEMCLIFGERDDNNDLEYGSF